MVWFLLCIIMALAATHYLGYLMGFKEGEKSKAREYINKPKSE